MKSGMTPLRYSLMQALYLKRMRQSLTERMRVLAMERSTHCIWLSPKQIMLTY